MREDKTNDKSSLEKLNEDIYKRDFNQTRQGNSSGFSKIGKKSVKDNWDQATGNTQPENFFNENGEMKPKSLLKKFFIFSAVFFVVSLGIAAYFFFGGSNVVSSQNIDLEILGPASISGGKELSLQVLVTNKNKVPLELADLIVVYPEGTRASVGQNKELPRLRKSLGTINPGETASDIIKSVLFGKEGSMQEISFSLEYRVPGSNAIFAKEKKYSLEISSSPVSLEVETLKEASFNQEFSIKISISSNSDTKIEDVALRIDYPFGFKPMEGSPKPVYGNNVWKIGDMLPGGKTIIVVKGVINGQDEEEKTFNFYVGQAKQDNEREMSAIYSSVSNQVTIKKPFIGIYATLNGDDSQEYISYGGEDIRVDVTWVNNLPTKVVDASIEAVLSGEAFDKSSVSVDRGFYDSSKNTVTWSKDDFPELSSLETGQSGRMSFTFSPKVSFGGQYAAENPKINLKINVKGKRVSESETPEEASGVTEKIIKINSDLKLTGRAVYYFGPFENTGPIPPKAEKETTYTVIWTVTNSSNYISGAKVKAFLPSYVKWQGVVSPQSEKVIFNGLNGEVSWDLGDVPPKTGQSGKTKEVAFQVSLLHSLSHVGKTPVIVSDIILSGIDNFTGAEIRDTKGSLTTSLSTDPKGDKNSGAVIE
ncbi:MAG: hypothetical protein AAB888_01295 [Patescibacteria group bacterium]